jgi:ribokinase
MPAAPALPSGRVVVVGSVNLDLVYRVPHLPRPGETLLGSDLVHLSGGKGGNQAHAAARLAGDEVVVSMIACVGSDSAAEQLRHDLETAGVDISGVRSVPGPSGTALIAVDAQGENTIVVIPGANGAWPPDVVEGLDLQPGDIVVVQLEVPFEIVEAVVTRAAASGARVVLNAAPLDRRVSMLLDRVEILVVNEVEARELFGLDTALDRDAVSHLAAETSTDLVVTLGAQGVIVARRGAGAESIPAYVVETIDTVGAGDAFVGGLAVALASGAPIDVAAKWGSAAGALTTTVVGARHESLDRGAVEALAGPLGVPPGLSSPPRGTD